MFTIILTWFCHEYENSGDSIQLPSNQGSPDKYKIEAVGENSDDMSSDVGCNTKHSRTVKNCRRIINDSSSASSSSSNTSDSSNVNLLNSFHQSDIDVDSESADGDDCYILSADCNDADIHLKSKFDQLTITNDKTGNVCHETKCKGKNHGSISSSEADEGTVVLTKKSKVNQRRYVLDDSSLSSSTSCDQSIESHNNYYNNKISKSSGEECLHVQNKVIPIESAIKAMNDIKLDSSASFSSSSASKSNSTVILKSSKGRKVIELDDEASEIPSHEDDPVPPIEMEELIGQGWKYSDDKKSFELSKDYISKKFPIASQSNKPFQNICLPAKIYNRLYEHQKIGVQWLASLRWAGIGGILGDDMGMVRYIFMNCSTLII